MGLSKRLTDPLHIVRYVGKKWFGDFKIFPILISEHPGI
jgi:hypothetical protein